MTTTTCEDYPCCGHLYGECADRPEFTSEYWLNNPHLMCDHEAGVCDAYEDEVEDDECDHDTGCCSNCCACCD